MLRRMLLGLVGVTAVCGAVGAEPHAEGRDYYLPEPPAVATEDSAPGPLAAADRDAFWAVLLGAHEAITDEFTMPLGTASTAGM